LRTPTGADDGQIHSMVTIEYLNKSNRVPPEYREVRKFLLGLPRARIGKELLDITVAKH